MVINCVGWALNCQQSLPIEWYEIILTSLFKKIAISILAMLVPDHSNHVLDTIPLFFLVNIFDAKDLYFGTFC